MLPFPGSPYKTDFQMLEVVCPPPSFRIPLLSSMAQGIGKSVGGLQTRFRAVPEKA